MAYSDHFNLADEFIGHADSVIGDIRDDFIKSRYIGFIAVAGVTAYELAFKDIVFEFADRKHVLLGAFSRDAYERLNGRIRLGDIRGAHIKRFGTKYLERFDRKLGIAEINGLRTDGHSIKASYDNFIGWRHKFAHTGKILQGPTYDEAKRSYASGKKVLDCLAQSMVR